MSIFRCLFTKKTNEFIGQCGITKQEVDGKIKIEVGYHVFKKYLRQGYAPEAVKLFIDYAFENAIASSLISIIDIRNINSQIVADKKRALKRKANQVVRPGCIYLSHRKTKLPATTNKTSIV